MSKAKLYRQGVGLLLFNKRREIFVAQRLDSAKGAWQMPQGGIDKGETPRTAALRELKEETGTDLAEIVAESQSWLRYDLPPKLASKLWGGRYKGQEQKWFALRFLGQDSDIDINTEKPEFSDWRWVKPSEALTLIVPFKRALYADVLAEFAALLRV